MTHTSCCLLQNLATFLWQWAGQNRKIFPSSARVKFSELRVGLMWGMCLVVSESVDIDTEYHHITYCGGKLLVWPSLGDIISRQAIQAGNESNPVPEWEHWPLSLEVLKLEAISCKKIVFTCCIFSKSKQGLCIWWTRLVLDFFLKDKTMQCLVDLDIVHVSLWSQFTLVRLFSCKPPSSQCYQNLFLTSLPVSC